MDLTKLNVKDPVKADDVNRQFQSIAQALASTSTTPVVKQVQSSSGAYNAQLDDSAVVVRGREPFRVSLPMGGPSRYLLVASGGAVVRVGAANGSLISGASIVTLPSLEARQFWFDGSTGWWVV